MRFQKPALIVLAALAANINQLAWKELPKSNVAKFMFATAALAILSVPGAYWPGGSAKFLPTAYLQTFLVFLLVATAFIHRPTLWIGIHVFVFGAFAAAILGFIAVSWREDRLGALLFLPYAAWVGFASLLNATLLALN